MATVSVCVLLLLMLSACGEQEPLEPLISTGSISVETGRGEASADRGWSLLRCEITGGDADFDGSVVVSGWVGPDRDPVRYEKIVQIPRETARRFEIPVRSFEWTRVELEFRQGSQVTRVARELVPKRDPHLRALAISETPRDFRALDAFVESLIDRSSVDPADSGRIPASVDSISARRLPSSSRAYDGYQLVLLWGENLASAQESEFGALADWVERGGTLVAIPGETWGVQTSRRLRELLGFKPGDTDDARPPELAEKLGRQRAASVYRPLLPTSDASWNLDETAIVHRHGIGQTTTLRFALTQEAFPDRSTHAPTIEALRPAIARALSFSGSWNLGLAALENRAASTLASTVEPEIPSRGEVIITTLAYLTFGFLVPWAIFQRRARRQWTYVVITLTAVGGVAAVGIFGFLSALPGRHLAEMNVVRLAPDSSQACVTSLFTIVSPGVGSFDANPGGEQKAVTHPLRARIFDRRRFDQRFKELPIPRTVSRQSKESDSSRLDPVRLYPNGPRFFRSDYPLDVSGLLHVRTKSAGASPGSLERVEVQNHSTRRLHALFVDGGQVHNWGEIDAGTTGRFSVLAETHATAQVDASQLGPLARLSTLGRTEGDSSSAHSTSAHANATSARVFGRAAGLARAALPLQTWSILYPDDSEALDADTNAWIWQEDVPIPEFTSPTSELRSAQPRQLLLWTDGPLFPDANETPLREACTVYVIELPPAHRS